MWNTTYDLAPSEPRAARPTGLILLAALTLIGASACLKPIITPPTPSGPDTPSGPEVTDPEAALPTSNCEKEGCPPLGKAAQTLSPMDCPTGQCIPDNSNGQGIYIVEGSDFCFKQGTESRFCPEAFVNMAPGKVVLRGRDRLVGPPFYTATVRGVLPDQLGGGRNGGPSGSVVIHSIHGDGAQLSVNYCRDINQCTKPEQLTTLQGSELAGFTFEVLLRNVPDEETFFEMQFLPLDTSRLLPPHRVPKYEIRYRQRDPNGNHPAWLNPCGKNGSRAGVLPNRVVDDMNAAVTPDSTVTTLGCESGAIVTCMDWGYRPWNPQTQAPDEHREYVYGSCLQAKRAAYFVGLGDLTSYTVAGTHILKRDMYGFGRNEDSALDRIVILEALWSPRGAVCLHPGNRRRPEIPLPPALARQVPACDPAVQWLDTARLATGPIPRR